MFVEKVYWFIEMVPSSDWSKVSILNFNWKNVMWHCAISQPFSIVRRVVSVQNQCHCIESTETCSCRNLWSVYEFGTEPKYLIRAPNKSFNRCSECSNWIWTIFRKPKSIASILTTNQNWIKSYDETFRILNFHIYPSSDDIDVLKLGPSTLFQSKIY